jgi:hypothetical protein
MKGNDRPGRDVWQNEKGMGGLISNIFTCCVDTGSDGMQIRGMIQLAHVIARMAIRPVLWYQDCLRLHGLN